ncbi:MAG: hypothetical protein B7X00_00485 [Legionella sp. 21-45-4]|nr:MAG: hypothetical protein B7X00_00485 [Legionella sp. 21-45-4]
MHEKSQGLSLLELLISLSILLILVFSSGAFFAAVSANSVRARCVEDFKGLLSAAKVYAMLKQESVLLEPIGSEFDWAKGVLLVTTAGHETLREWRWKNPGLIIHWHGFQDEKSLRIDADLSQLAMNGTFSLRYQGQRLANIVVTRLGDVH